MSHPSPAPLQPPASPGGTPTRIGLAVIGAGMAWAPHRDSLRDLAEHFEVRWIAGRDATRLAPQAQHFPGARISTDWREVLGDGATQAALVLTPPAAHEPIITALAAAGRHVLVEKPIAIDTPASRRAVQACAAHGVRLSVMLQHRMRPAALRLRELLTQGALGPLTSAAVDVRWWRPQTYYDQPGRGTRARDGGGVLMTQAIHTLDLFLQLIAQAGAPVQDLRAYATTTPTHQMECEDTVTAILRLSGGALATLNATTAAYPGFSDRIELAGTAGTAILSGDSLDVHYMDGRAEQAGASARAGFGADPMAFTHELHRAVLADFAQAVRTGRDGATSGTSALAVHEFIDALLESAGLSARPGPSHG